MSNMNNKRQRRQRRYRTAQHRRGSIFRRIAQLFRGMTLNTKLIIAEIILLTIAVLVLLSYPKPQAEAVQPSTGAGQETEADAPEYVFTYGNGYPIDLQALTDSWTTPKGDEDKRYNLTDAERYEVASVVTAEAEGEPYAGKIAVAQCILQACEDDGIRPTEVLVTYCYSPNRPEPTAEALEAVRDVFDFGNVVTTEPIKYFYAPAKVESEWHESQSYVLEINGHRFFTERGTHE